MVLAALTCPCHLLILALLLAGTTAGAYLTDNLGVLVLAFGTVFLASLFAIFRRSPTS